MSIYVGKSLRVEIDGTSHGSEIVLKVKGMKGLSFDENAVTTALERRSPRGVAGATERVEKDIPVYCRGIDGGRIKGTFTIKFKNSDVKSRDYDDVYALPRPAHADLGRYYKFGDLNFTGGGEFSGRITVALCTIGAIAADVLAKKYGTRISARVVGVGNASGDEDNLNAEVLETKSRGDSVGGRVECVISNCPKGLGGSLFDGLDGKISELLFAIPAVRGVEFGDGFKLCEAYGSEVNDSLVVKDGCIEFERNCGGGICGGISCSDEIKLAVAFKPTPSIRLPQRTVKLTTYENAVVEVKGRHDACIALRATPIVEGVVALAILDEVLYENQRRDKKRNR